MKKPIFNNNFGFFTLFITSGTLICCALPIILVSFGLGAVVASLNYNIPALLFLAEHKLWILAFSALLLIFLAWLIYRANQSCPRDKKLAKYCETTKKWNKRIFLLSLIIWIIGFAASYLLLPLRRFLDI